MMLFSTVVLGVLIGFGILRAVDVIFLLLWHLAIRRQERP